MSKEKLETFISQFPNFYDLKLSDQIDYYVYYLTVEENAGGTQATQIRECFLLCDLTPYTNISQYLINNLKGKNKLPPKFLRIKDKYQLHRSLKQQIESNFSDKPHSISISKSLRDLLSHVNNAIENDFLKEAINCFEIGAYRATIIMTWNLTIDHLYEYILNHKLADFNNVLSKNTDKRIKITSVNIKDDFNEIPENKFIEFTKSANIISNDIRKILDTKLGIRNTSAHPSNIKILESKAIEFVEDLITNVIMKYNL